MYRLYLGSVLAGYVVGNASGLKANDSALYVIQIMSDTPDSSLLSFSFSLSGPVDFGTLVVWVNICRGEEKRLKMYRWMDDGVKQEMEQ